MLYTVNYKGTGEKHAACMSQYGWLRVEYDIINVYRCMDTTLFWHDAHIGNISKKCYDSFCSGDVIV